MLKIVEIPLSNCSEGFHQKNGSFDFFSIFSLDYPLPNTRKFVEIRVQEKTKLSDQRFDVLQHKT